MATPLEFTVYWAGFILAVVAVVAVALVYGFWAWLLVSLATIGGVIHGWMERHLKDAAERRQKWKPLP